MNNWVSGMLAAAGRRAGIDAAYFVRSGSWSLLSDGILLLAGLIVAVVFARVASPEEFGQFQLVLSILGLVAVVSIKGFESVVIRDVSRGLEGVYRQVVRTRFWWAWLAAPVLLLFATYQWQHDATMVALALLAAAILAPAHYTTQLWPSYFKGASRFDLLARFTAVRAVVTTVAVLAAIFATDGNPLLVFLVYFGVQLAVNALIMRQSLRRVANDAVSSDWRSFGYFITKTGLLKTAASNLDGVLIGLFISPAALAVYAVAMVVPKYALLTVKSLLQTTLPRLSHRNSLTFRELALALVAGFFFTALTLAVSRLVIVPLFGEKYTAAVSLAYIGSLAMLLHPLAQLLSNFAQMTSNRRVVLATNTLNPLLRITLLLVFGALWKTTGVAVAGALASFTWVVISLAASRIDLRRRIIQ